MLGLAIILVCVTTTLSAPSPPNVAVQEYEAFDRSDILDPQGRFLFPFGPYILSPLGQGLLGLGALGLLLNNKKKTKKDIKMKMDAGMNMKDAMDDEMKAAMKAVAEAGNGGRSLNFEEEYPLQGPDGRFLYPFGPYILSPLGLGTLAGLTFLAAIPSQPKKMKKDPKKIKKDPKKINKVLKKIGHGRDLLNALAYEDLDIEQEFGLEEEFYRNLVAYEEESFEEQGRIDLSGLDLSNVDLNNVDLGCMDLRGLDLYTLDFLGLDLKQELSCVDLYDQGLHHQDIDTIIDFISENSGRALDLDTLVDQNIGDFIHTGRALDFVNEEELDAIIDREVNAAVKAGLDLDRNRDGRIDRNEFHWTFPNLDLYEEFGRFDVDNSGFIEQSEILVADESQARFSPDEDGEECFFKNGKLHCM